MRNAKLTLLLCTFVCLLHYLAVLFRTNGTVITVCNEDGEIEQNEKINFYLPEYNFFFFIPQYVDVEPFTNFKRGCTFLL
jgi:hypothetical protein